MEIAINKRVKIKPGHERAGEEGWATRGPQPGAQYAWWIVLLDGVEGEHIKILPHYLAVVEEGEPVTHEKGIPAHVPGDAEGAETLPQEGDAWEPEEVNGGKKSRRRRKKKSRKSRRRNKSKSRKRKRRSGSKKKKRRRRTRR